MRHVMSSRVERVRGMNDVLPRDYETQQRIKETLRQVFEAFGYRPIDVPVVEYASLYLKKSGDEIISRLYAFTHQNRELSLRPEITASVMRAYVESLQGLPLPVRLYYSGPVFRHEKPQRGRYRQFAQMGIELIGASGPRADAEVICVACKGLDRLDISNYRVVVGHAGVMSEYLDSIGLKSHLRSLLLANMEVLRQKGRQCVIDRLCDVYPTLHSQTSEKNFTHAFSEDERTVEHVPGSETLRDFLLHLDETSARLVILDLLKSIDIDLGGSRRPHEIVDRLLVRMRNQDQGAKVDQALGFMGELAKLTGEPSVTLGEADKILRAHGIGQTSLKELEELVNALQCHDLDWSRIVLDLGLGRGLHYHTGINFEIHSGALGPDSQLCGGGRYDALIRTFGGHGDVAAAGFSYGLERLRSLLQCEENSSDGGRKPPDALVIAVGSGDYCYAVKVSALLRGAGLSIEVDVRGRSVRSNLRYADRRSIPFAIIVGSEESKVSNVVLKDMFAQKEYHLSVDAAVGLMRHNRL